MHYTKQKATHRLLCLTFAAVFAITSTTLPVNAASSKKSRPAISSKKMTIGIGKTTALPKVKVTSKTKGAVYTFTSSNKKVATVGKTTGSLIGKASGKATITVTQNLKKKKSKIGTCQVTVTPYAAKKKTIPTLQMNIGEKETIKLTSYFQYLNASASYKVSSSNSSLISVSGTPAAKNAYRFTVNPKKEGTAKLSITQTYKGKKKTIGTMSIQIKANTDNNALLEGPLDKIMEKIYAGVKAELPETWNKEINADNASYYLGTDKLDYEEAIASEAMINVVPFSVCLIRMPQGSDIEAAKKTIADNVNPARWVCVSVDPKNVLVGNIENLIILVMSDTAPKEILNSFFALKNTDSEVLISKPDKNGIIQKGEYYSKSLDAYNEKSVINLAGKIDGIIEKYIKPTANTYYSIIPDKSYFMKSDVITSSDYEKMIKKMETTVKKPKYISIVDTLTLDDYYKTDLHWRQEKILDTANTLGKTMGFTLSADDFTTNTMEGYKGIYAPYIKGTVPSETLTYLTSQYTKNAIVQIYGQDKTTSVYNLDKWTSDVPYDLFLSGPSPLVTITNTDGTKGKELILFGDSFTSSLAPLLLQAYEKITLVDLRFIASDYLDQFLTFENQDVLFLYNTAVLNKSAMLR